MKCVDHAVYFGQSADGRSNAGMAIGAASVGSQGEAIAEIAAMKEAGMSRCRTTESRSPLRDFTRQVMEYCRSAGFSTGD